MQHALRQLLCWNQAIGVGMARLPVRLLLCASSYSPLLLLLGLRSWSASPLASELFLITAVVSVILLWVYLRLESRRAKNPVSIKAVQQRDGDVMGYVITYLIPFVGINVRNAAGELDRSNLLSICLLFAVIVVIYVNANLIFINPVLALVGYRIYEVEICKTGEKKALLTRRQVVHTSEPLEVISLGPYFLWEPSR